MFPNEVDSDIPPKQQDGAPPYFDISAREYEPNYLQYTALDNVV